MILDEGLGGEPGHHRLPDAVVAKPYRLALTSARYYWRTNLAVTLGVAAAVAVLAGALVVGDSVRGSLRDIALGRLGNTDQVLSSMGFSSP